MKNIIVRILSFILLVSVMFSCSQKQESDLKGVIPFDLKCEYQTDPMGIDQINPVLSWKIKSEKRGQIQTAYQLIVSDNKESLEKESGNIWDSKKIKTNKSENILFEGSGLKSGKAYYWRVRVWDKKGKKSQWSDVSKLEMGLMEKSDWQGSWISDGKTMAEKPLDHYKEDPAPLFRKEISLNKKILEARLYITGLGYYEAEINGNRVGGNMLDPAWTNYDKRIFYSTYDVGGMLNDGQNCIGVSLGNGWYNPLPLKMWGGRNIRTSLPLGRPCFIAQLNIEFEDGTKASYFTDDNWKVHEGPILRNSVYLGEIYDARKEIKGWSAPGIDEKDWSASATVTGPLGKLQSQFLPPIKVTKTIVPKEVSEISKGVYIIDMGENFAGWINLKAEGGKGRKIKLRYGELLNEDKSLNVMTAVAGQIKRKGVGGPGSPDIAWQEDIYILKGEGVEEYTPAYSFHGFRYIEVSGYPGVPTNASITGKRLSSSIETTGSFECSNEMLNKIQKITQNTFLSNIFSVQSDCPHREKFGYGGDLATTCDAFIMNYDMETFYSKAVYDWADAVRPDGMLTDEAPFVGIQYCGVGWALVHPLLLNKLYQYYGNIRIVRDQYETSKKWFELVISQNPDFIIKDGLSDHESLNPTPAPELVTPLYYYSAKLMSKLAKILDKNEDSDKYSVLAENIKKKYIEEFLNPGTGEIGTKTQTNQSFALWLDMVPENEKGKALEFLLNKIIVEKDSHFTTGIYATKFIFDILSETGNIDLAYKVVNQKTFPGYGYMLENGATTLWEHWALSEDTFSHNHPMFGTVSEWFYKWLGGIQPDSEAIGFDKIIIRPQIASGLEWVKSDYNSVKGLIKSDWTVKNGIFKLHVIIPPNSTAIVHLPTSDAEKNKESGKLISNIKEVNFEKYENGAAIYSIGSGEYFFESDIN